MARFDSGVFGLLRGKIDNIVARLRYGKVYVARKPLIYKTKSEKVKLTRKVFSRRQRLNHELRKHPNVKTFWKAVEAGGLNDNTKPLIRNTPFVTYERFLPGCGFTPVSDNKINVQNIRFEGRNIVFDFKLERSNTKILEPPYDVYCILVLDRWFEKTYEGIIRHKEIFGETNFMTIENEIQEPFQTFSCLYFDSIHQRMYRSEKAYIMIAAIKLNEKKKNYEWTDTYFEELFNFIPDDKKIKPGEPIYKYYD